jgi:hypothetical protein
MEHSTSLETDNLLIAQKIPNFCETWSLLQCWMDPILSHLNPVHILTSYEKPFLILYSHLRLGLLSDLFPLGFLTKMCVHIKYSVHQTLLDLITLNNMENLIYISIVD